MIFKKYGNMDKMTSINNTIYELRILFHESIYNKEGYGLSKFAKLLNDSKLFTVENILENIIYLKIKKTNIKKLLKNLDTVSIYNIIVPIYYNYLMNYKEEVNKILFDKFQDYDIDYFYNNNHLHMLINIFNLNNNQIVIML